MIFWEEKGITALMAISFLVSIGIRIFLGTLYAKLIREAEQLETTKNPLLQSCLMRYRNLCQKRGGCANIQVFVEHCLDRMTIGSFRIRRGREGLTPDRLYHFSGQAQLLSVAAAGLGICRSLMLGRSIAQVLPFYIACFAGVYLYCMASTMADVSGKRIRLRDCLVDHLENFKVCEPVPRNNLADTEDAFAEAVERAVERATAAALAVRENGTGEELRALLMELLAI